MVEHDFIAEMVFLCAMAAVAIILFLTPPLTGMLMLLLVTSLIAGVLATMGILLLIRGD